MSKKDAQKDDLSAVPPAVRRQGNAATKLQRDIVSGNKKPPEPALQKPLVPTNPEPPRQKPNPDPPAQNPAPVYAPPAISDPSIQPSSDFEAKYKVLKGKYDHEVPALQQEVQSLKMVIEQLQQAVSSPPPAQSAPEVKSLDPEKFSEYGDEIVMLADSFNKLLEQNKILAQKVESPNGQTVEPERFQSLEQHIRARDEHDYYAMLDEKINDWRLINRSDAFSKWLDEIDPISMAPRRDIIQYAANTLNAPQVINIFNKFKEEISARQESQPSPVNPDLNNRVMPNANVAPVDPMDPSGQNTGFPTLAELKQATRDYTKHLITEKEYNDIAARYQKAVKAGKAR